MLAHVVHHLYTYIDRSAPVSPTHYSSTGMFTPGEMSREGSDGEEETSSPGSRQLSAVSIASHPTSAAGILHPAQSRLLHLHGAAAVRTIQSAPGSPQSKLRCDLTLI